MGEGQSGNHKEKLSLKRKIKEEDTNAKRFQTDVQNFLLQMHYTLEVPKTDSIAFSAQKCL